MRLKLGPTFCPICDEQVYFAEELRAVGKSFHRQCFKCIVCNKPLDSFTVNEHDGKLYCKKCLVQINGPQTYRPIFNSVSVCSNLDRRSQSQTRLVASNSPVRCRPTYSRTSESLENGYYSTRISPMGRQYSSYWDDSSGSAYRPSRPRWVNSTVGGARCANCADLVFANERVDAVGKAFHRLCFKCADCRRLLDRGSVCDHNRDIFCQKCYTKNFGSIGFKAGTHLRCE